MVKSLLQACIEALFGIWSMMVSFPAILAANASRAGVLSKATTVRFLPPFPCCHTVTTVEPSVRPLGVADRCKPVERHRAARS